MKDRSIPKDPALAALTPPGYLTPTPLWAGTFGGNGGSFVSGALFAGRYRMVALLGSSASGEVWRADDLVLQAPVALKLLPNTGGPGPSRILDQVRLARQITHPAVCRVFDVGESDGRLFFSMELVEGEDLATLLRRAGRLPVEKVIEIGGQLCDAVTAAHAQGVLHLNLKLSNVLIDAEGFIRVTDFGIGMDVAGDPACRDYLAPEQLEAGAPVSQRTDVYAIGVILYELLVGRETPGDARHRSGRWLKPSRFVPEISSRLERAVLAAVEREPRHRPGSAAALGERLRQAIGPIDRPWGWIVAGCVIVAGLLAGIGSYFYMRPAPTLSARDTMVVADFVNTTGEPVFDGALKVALAVSLEQSPFLRVFPDERARETLRLMERSPDAPVTRDVAREIALREQLKALVAGSIAKFGSNYVLAIEAINAQSGDVIAREQVEVPDREQVLSALGEATSRLRNRLGESLTSVQRFDVPLARATTASLDALHAYSLALDDGRMNMQAEAIPHLQRAIELDPQFALAQALLSGLYWNTGRSAEAPAHSRRAFELRDRVSERERFFISWRYYIDATQAWDQALATATSWTRTYSREPFAFNSVGLASAAFGRHETAVDAFRTAISLDRRFLPPHGNMVGSLIALGRYDDARAAIRDAREAGIDAMSLHRGTYWLALLSNDATAMESALAAARKTAVASLPSHNWEARTAAFGGRITASHELFQVAIRQADAAGQHESAAQWQAEDAEAHAVVGDCAAATAELPAALARSRDNFTLERAARTFAVCSRDADASAIRADLERRFPDATLTRQIHLPVVDALLTLRQQPAQALDRLEGVRPYDNAPSAEFWPGYVRGLAYLAMKDGAKAEREFQQIVDHRGAGPAALVYPLATLGAARAAALTGAPDRARRGYEEFFRLWKQGDAGTSPLLQARREYAALR